MILFYTQREEKKKLESYVRPKWFKVDEKSKIFRETVYTIGNKKKKSSVKRYIYFKGHLIIKREHELQES